MKTKNLHYLLLSFLTLTLLTTSCDKSKDDVEPDKATTLVSHDWKGDKILVNNVNVSAIPGVGSNADSFQTLYLTFRSDNTYTSTFTVQGKEQTQDGTWTLSPDGNKITFDLFGELNILSLTDEEMVLSTTLSQSNVQLIAGILGVDPTLIALFTGGKPLLTEMRFVKAE